MPAETAKKSECAALRAFVRDRTESRVPTYQRELDAAFSTRIPIPQERQHHTRGVVRIYGRVE